MNLDLFSHTIDHRFVFALFEFLLSGVISLVILKAGRSSAAEADLSDRRLLLAASTLLSLALAYSVFWTAARFFFQSGFTEAPSLLASHICLSSAWLLIAFQFLPGRLRSRIRGWILIPFLVVLSAAPFIVEASPIGASFELLARLLDGASLIVLVIGICLSFGSKIPARGIWIASLSLFCLSGVFHLANPEMAVGPLPAGRLLSWNLEHFFFLAGLFLLSLAIGEWSTNLFDIVFVRIQIAFMLLASLIILVIIRNDRAEYLARLQDRSSALVEFLTLGLESAARGGMALSWALDREDLLGRITKDFGDIHQLTSIRLKLGEQTALISINSEGEIKKAIESASPASGLEAFPVSEGDLLIRSVGLEGAAGNVQLYGAKSDFHSYIQRRILLIFSLFSGGVALATMMVGLVVYAAERTLRRQEEEIRKKQEELQMASKMAMLGELAGSVAHEVNNPAAAIMSRASFMIKRWKGRQLPKAARDDLAAILEQAQRIAQITASMLGFSRRHVFETGPVAICEVVEKSISLVEDDLKSNSIEVEVDGCPSPERLLGDRNSLVQAFVNLLRNSIAAMPEGGCITIQTSRCKANGALTIRLSDTGTGIAQENLPRIFEPFFTTKEVGKGTGIGLSVVYGIIAEHKGSIRVQSRKGLGTTFQIELPCSSGA